MYGDADFGLAISTKSKVRPAAETFVKWMATSTEGQQVIADQLNDLPSLTSVKPNFDNVELVDPAIQKDAVQQLITKASAVTQPRQALLNADVQNGLLAAATSVATGKASPQDAAKTLQQAAEAAGVTFK
jgi:ABC-type glycerol-3-phosphate transport system substrate-binding protein